MKRFAMALALVCGLSTSIFAGDMPTTGAVGDPPPPPTTTLGETSAPPEAAETQGPTLLETVILTIITLPR